MKFNFLLISTLLLLALVTTSCTILDDGNTIYYPEENETYSPPTPEPSIQTLISCSEANGYNCEYNEYCPNYFWNVSDTNSCCSSPCTQFQKTNTCNYNTIFEGWEDLSCKDSQCKGTVCGGLCYNTEGNCCNGKFTNEECNSIKGDLKVEFDFPQFYRVTQKVSGNIIFTNTGSDSVNLGLGWSYGSIFQILTDSGKNLYDEPYLFLSPGESKTIPITITPKEEMNLLLRPLDIFNTIQLTTRDVENNLLYFKSHYMQVLPYDKISNCGNNQFGVEGKCINNIFYPEMECIGEETGNVKDYSDFCANGFLFIEGQRLFYNYSINTISIREPSTLSDLKAVGTKKVFVTRLNNNINIDVNSMKNWVEKFYDIQSEKFAENNMVDFEFEDKGSIIMDWDKINEKSPTVYQDIRSQIEKQLNINSNEYDILIGFTNKSNSKVIFNESGGVYLPGARVILMDVKYPESYYLVAHEIAHSFGAPDLYLNGSYTMACGFHFINDIMCGSSLLSTSSTLNPPPESFEFNTAPFIGWGDIDGDGVLDVNDNYIARAPSWSQGIEILDIHPVIANQGTPNEQFSVNVYVIDKKTQKLVPSIITITASNVLASVYSKSGFISNTFTTVPTSPIDINVKAEYGGFADTQTITFDPSTYSYRSPKYDPSIHDP